MSKPWRMEVRWLDSTILHEGWRPVTDILERKARLGATRCTSVGFVLADDDVGITLAGSVHGNEAAGIVHIPRGAIVRRRRLR